MHSNFPAWKIQLHTVKCLFAQYFICITSFKSQNNSLGQSSSKFPGREEAGTIQFLCSGSCSGGKKLFMFAHLKNGDFRVKVLHRRALRYLPYMQLIRALFPTFHIVPKSFPEVIPEIRRSNPWSMLGIAQK